MILHCVWLRTKPESEQAFAQLMLQLDGVVSHLPGASNLQHGTLQAIEEEPGYNLGFTILFDEEAGLKLYARDAEHQEIGKALIALCENGREGLKVYDLKLD